MFSLIRHIGETRRQYVFERDSLDDLREWAERFIALVAVSELAGYLVGGATPPLEGVREVLPGAFSAWAPREARFVELLMQWVAANGEDAVHARASEFIALPELCDEYEFVRSLRWSAVDDSLHPEHPATFDGARAGTHLGWHRALSWLFEPGADWDEVDLST